MLMYVLIAGLLTKQSKIVYMLMHALIAGLLTKQSKIVYHDKSYSFETDLG